MKRRLLDLVVALVSALALTTIAAPTAHASTTPTSETYVALGDSYPAGTFLQPGQLPYPALIAGATGGVTLLADSGLTAADLLAGLASEPRHPGVRWVTLTVGANDTQWSGLLLGCVQAGADCDHLQVMRTLNRRIDALTATLPALIRELHRVFPNATIYWSGYVRPFGPTSLRQSCAVPVPGLGTVAVPAIVGAAIDATVVNLNARIAGAVLLERLHRVPVRYVAADPLFASHRYCGSDPWFNTLHPNVEGQAAYARAFERAGMPTG